MPAIKPMEVKPVHQKIGGPGATMYKDFNKDITDLVNKNYAKPASWKLECKFKGPKDVVYVNPQYDNGKVSADVHYDVSQCGAKVKVNVSSTADVKLTTTYEEKGHKVEAVVANNGNYEVSYEGVVAGMVRLHDKLTKQAVEAGMSMAVGQHCQVGCGSTYTLKGGACQWNVGCRYAANGRVIDVTSAQLKVFTTGILFPIPKYNVRVAANTTCTVGHGWDVTVGVESQCPLRADNKVRARITKSGEWAVGYIAKLADKWTAAITLDRNLKAGVILTHE